MARTPVCAGVTNPAACRPLFAGLPLRRSAASFPRCVACFLMANFFAPRDDSRNIAPHASRKGIDSQARLVRGSSLLSCLRALYYLIFRRGHGPRCARDRMPTVFPATCAAGTGRTRCGRRTCSRRRSPVRGKAWSARIRPAASPRRDSSPRWSPSASDRP